MIIGAGATMPPTPLLQSATPLLLVTPLRLPTPFVQPREYRRPVPKAPDTQPLLLREERDVLVGYAEVPGVAQQGDLARRIAGQFLEEVEQPGPLVVEQRPRRTNVQKDG